MLKASFASRSEAARYAANQRWKDHVKVGVANSIVDRVKANGGLSVKMLTGEEPTGGFMVARREFSKIVNADEFFDATKGKATLTAYLKQYREQLTNDCYFGLWHDTKNNEVVFDVVDNIGDREQAIQTGRERNQQAIWDVTGQSEIDTGGTGDRESSDVPVETTKAVVRDDGSRDRVVRFRDVGRVLNPKQTVAFEVIKRSFASRSEAGRYAANQRWQGQGQQIPAEGTAGYYIRGIGPVRRDENNQWVDSYGVPLAPSVTRDIRIKRQMDMRDQYLREGGKLDAIFDAKEVSDRTAQGLKSEIPPARLKEVLEVMADGKTDPNILNITLSGAGNNFGINGLGLRREQMPQVPSQLKPKFLSDLEARGVEVTREELWSSTLTPIQGEISGRTTGQIMRRMESGKDIFADDYDAGAILISKDNYVIDGHHRWAAGVASEYAGSKTRIRTIRIGLSHQKVLDLIQKWDDANGVKPLTLGQQRNPDPVAKLAAFCKAVDLALLEDVA
jgi:hypothetical protein